MRKYNCARRVQFWWEDFSDDGVVLFAITVEGGPRK
jgi:hypothetical protein